MKRLYKSNKDRIFFGVIGGIGEYFDIDPSLLRILFIFLVIFTGILPGVIMYILFAIVVPRKIEDKED
jgi:phage shock protein C